MSLTGEQALGAARKIVKKEMHKVYRPAGTKTVAELTSDLLVAENLGNVYNAADSGVTTSDFVEGPGKTINAGDNIDIVDIGSGDTHVYKFDLYMGADLSSKADKVTNATSGHLAGLDTSGNLVDSGKKATDFADLTILAPEFNSTTAYGVGDYVTYDGSLYRFKSAHSAGAWNSNQVVEIKAVGQYVTAGKKSETTLGAKATAEGFNTEASSAQSHAEGYGTEASGESSHAEGDFTTASGSCSHAEGSNVTASGENSHAEGDQTEASGDNSHAEGSETIASGDYSHAEGDYTAASGETSHAGGTHTIAQRKSQTAIGEYNVADTTGADGTVKGKYVFIIGNGTSLNARSNALTVDWDGNLEVAGNVNGTNLNTGTDTATGNPAVFSTISEQLSKQTTVNIEPIQNLHGYDKPWNGGAGKNKLEVSSSIFFSNITDGVIKDNGKNGIRITGHKTTGGWGDIYFTGIELKLSANTSYVLSCGMVPSNVRGLTLMSGNTIVCNIATGASEASYTPDAEVTITQWRVTIADNAESMLDFVLYPMVRLATESDSTYSPYSNICPISGLNSVVVERCGKNLYVGSPNFDGYTNRSSWSSETEKYNNHEVISRNSTWNGCYKQLTLEAGTYTFSVMAKASATCECQLYVVNINETQYRQIVSVGTSWQRYSYTFTLPENAVVVPRVEAREESKNIYISEYQLEPGSTATPYEEYNGQTSTTTLPTTVYGGTLDLTNGRLVVDRAIVTFDGSDDEGWNATNGKSCETLLLASMIKKTANNQIANIKCNRLSAGTANNIYSGTIGIAVDNAGYICVDIDGTTHTTAEYKTWLSNNPLQVVYELATPVITTITPSSLSLLKGLNVVSTNGDTVEVTFNQGSLATLEDVADANAFKFDKADVANMEGDTASKAYYVGNYMLREDGFYRVTANIASGAAITNNNTTKTTVGAELEENHSDILNLATDLNNPLIIDRNISPGATDIEDLNNYALFKFIEWKNDSNPDGTILCSLYVFFSGELRNLISDRGYMKLLFTNTELTIARNGSSITISRDSSSSSDYKITVFLQNRFSV